MQLHQDSPPRTQVNIGMSLKQKLKLDKSASKKKKLEDAVDRRKESFQSSRCSVKQSTSLHTIFEVPPASKKSFLQNATKNMKKRPIEILQQMPDTMPTDPTPKKGRGSKLTEI